jgi:hypothetical protein
MTNRTLQFYGSAYAFGGTEPILITADLNNSVIYSGTIPTEYTTEPSVQPADQVVLFTCEVPMNFAGTYLMNIYIDNPVGVNVYFEQIYSNYMAIVNPVFSPAQVEILKYGLVKSDKVDILVECAVPPLTQGEIAILNEGTGFSNPIQQDIIIAHNLPLYISTGPNVWTSVNDNNDPRSNVVVNGVAVSRDVDPPGTWGWMVIFNAETSGSISYDLTLISGYE